MNFKNPELRMKPFLIRDFFIGVAQNKPLLWRMCWKKFYPLMKLRRGEYKSDAPLKSKNVF